jgi:hypothetical protein
MAKLPARHILPLCMLVVFSTDGLWAQTVPVKFQGSLTLSGEVYSSSGIAARRPGSTARAIFTPTITLFDQISLPFEFYISNQDKGFRQPFNQFGVNPHLWGWLTLHAGYFSARISDLTFGDTRLVGGGVELTPGNFHFSVLYGRSQQAVAADTIQGIRGNYDRKILAAKIGYGNEEGWFLELNFMHSLDDSSSLQLPAFGKASDSVAAAYYQAPTENAVASLAYGMSFLDHRLQIKGETAISGFSNDIRFPTLKNPSVNLGSVFTPRTSSQVDAATILSVNIVPSSVFSLNLSGRWVGPGFVTLGYAQFQNDVLEYTIGPTVRLFSGSTSVRTSFGLRYNNLRSDRLSTTRRTIVNIGITSQVSQAFGFDVQYANFGMQSTPRNDTLRIDNIAQSFMVTPRFTFSEFGGTNVLVVSYSLQDFTDFNIVSGNLSSNKVNTGVLSWTLVFPSSLTFSTTLMGTSAVTSSLSTTIKGISETVGHSFFQNLLTTNVTIGYNLYTVNATNGQVDGRISASLNTKHWGTFTLMLTSNRFTYSDPTAGTSYGEYQGSLMYSIHF